MSLRERSETARKSFPRILVLAMTTAADDVSGSNFIREIVVFFSLSYKQIGAFWCSFLVGRLEQSN